MASSNLSAGTQAGQTLLNLGPAIAEATSYGESKARRSAPARWKLVSMNEGPIVTYGTLAEPEAAYRYWNEQIATDPEVSTDVESLFAIFLSARLTPLGHTRVAEGLLDQIMVHPREVFRTAIVANAHSIVIAHNHPSGDPTPSEGDVRATRDLVKAGKLLRIQLLDHLIIGRTSAARTKAWSSLRELGYFYE